MILLILLILFILFIIALFLSGYIRLHCMAKLKLRTIIIIQSLVFIVGEIIMGIKFFLI